MWANNHIKKLSIGETTNFKIIFNAEPALLNSRVTVEPIFDHSNLNIGDTVLCSINGSQSVRKIHSINKVQLSDKVEYIFQIFMGKKGRKFICAQSPQRHVYGKVTKVE